MNSNRPVAVVRGQRLALVGWGLLTGGALVWSAAALAYATCEPATWPIEIVAVEVVDVVDGEEVPVDDAELDSRRQYWTNILDRLLQQDGNHVWLATAREEIVFHFHFEADR